MKQKNNQTLKYVKTIAGTALAAAGGEAGADIVYFDESFSKQIVVSQQGSFGENEESLYLSTAGINSISGELQFQATAGRTESFFSGTKNLAGAVNLLGNGSGAGIGNAGMVEGEKIDATTGFNLAEEPLIEMDLADSNFSTTNQSFSGYLPIRFSVAGTTNFQYGWVEVEAMVELANGTSDTLDKATTLLKINRMAYESNWDEPIEAGQIAVPEPSVLILVLTTGIGTLAGRRIFPQIGNGEKTA
jgi:hypothetical protein